MTKTHFRHKNINKKRQQSTSFSVITLNTNDLKSSIKGPRLVEWIDKIHISVVYKKKKQKPHTTFKDRVHHIGGIERIQKSILSK